MSFHDIIVTLQRYYIRDDSPSLKGLGLLRIAPEGSVRAKESVATTPGGLWALKRPDVSAGTANGWDVTAFTRENDLSQNLQTVFFSQCANELVQLYHRLLSMERTWA